MAKKKSHRRRPQVPAVASRVLANRSQNQASGTQLAESQQVSADSQPAMQIAHVAQERTISGVTERVRPELKLVPPTPSSTSAITSPIPSPMSSTIAAKVSNDPFASSSRREDESSIPPVNMTIATVGEDAEKFFEEGERSESLHFDVVADEVEDDHPNDADFKRRVAPEVLARRARYRKLAQRVVAGFALLALVGIGKAALTRAPSAAGSQALLAHVIETSHHAQDAVVSATEKASDKTSSSTLTAAKAADIPAPPVAQTAQEEAKPAQAAPVDQAVVQAAPANNVVDAKPADAPVAAATTDLPAATAKEDKHAAQRALDKGDAKAAIARGERALETEPEDAETWLIVGAAYQSIGQNAKAHQAFSSCTHHAKRGPIGECSALR